MPTEAEASVPTEDWLIRLYVAVDTWWQREGWWRVPPRPGPPPVCSDQELVTLALAREFLERRSERAWRAEVLANWRHLFPAVPKQSEWNRRTRWLWAAGIAAQACAVLSAAHALSICHRDLKPTNLMLCPDGSVKVLDFGLALLRDGDVTTFTRIGQILETHALDDHAVANVEARDDAPRQHWVPASLATSMNRRSICTPAAPDFSGWNCVPNTRPRSATLANVTPCVVSATVASPTGAAYE